MVAGKNNEQQQQNNVIPCYALATPSPPPEPEQQKPIHNSYYYQDNRPPTPEPSPPLAPQSSTESLKPIAISSSSHIIKKSKDYITILQKLLKDLDGRDKLMKVIQYFIKILLHYRLIRTGKKEWPSTLASHFSLVRKILRLGTGIGPLKQLLSTAKRPFAATANTCIQFNELVNNVSDDVYCLYKMGIVSSSLGAKSEVISAYCWFLGIMVDLRENLMNFIQLKQKTEQSSQEGEEKDVRDQRAKDFEKLYLLQVSIVKLLMDGIFCGCDIWQPRYSAGIQAWSGFFSGVLSGYKLCIKFSA